MPNFIDLCRSCLSSNSSITANACKNESEDNASNNYIEQIKSIYSDLQLAESLPFQLCQECERLMYEANKISQYLNQQKENEQCYKLLLKEDVCSGCLENCTLLSDELSDSNALIDCNKKSIDVITTVFTQYPLDSHLSYKYCKSCCDCIKSAYRLKSLINKNSSSYEKYCVALTNVSDTNDKKTFSQLTIQAQNKTVHPMCTNFEKVYIKEEIIEDDQSISVQSKNDTLGSNDSSEQQQEEVDYDRKLNFDYNNVVRMDKSECKNKTLDIKCEIEIHEECDADGKSHVCDICSKSFIKKVYLIEHVRIHTGEKPFKCNYCSKSFCSKSNLRTHERIHTGVKPYVCNVCSKSFSQSSGLKGHERIHTGEKPFKCDQCEKSFTYKSHLKSHQRIHTGEMPYTCNTCFKSFRLKQHLEEHNRVHTGEKPYKCNYCPKSFSQSSNLMDHERIHTGDRPYKCSHCHLSFKTKSNLTRHERMHAERSTLV